MSSAAHMRRIKARRSLSVIDRRCRHTICHAALQRLPAARVGFDYIRSLRPTSTADRAHAARQHYIAESAIRTMGAYNRWTGEAMTGEIPARLSNAVMHLSLLDKWTDEGRRLFNKQVWAAITDNANKSWETLGKKGMDRRFRGMLTRYGLTESDWNSLRSTPLQEDGGAHWILPDNVLDQELSRRVAEMALQETEMAVPSSSLRIRAAIDANLRKGTVPGEIFRSALQFRGFPLQLFWSHGRRALEMGGWGATKYAATLFIASTLMGAISEELHNVANGQDFTDPLTDPLHFWARAAFRGGGLGIVGDLLQHLNRRTGGSFSRMQLGPVYSVADVGNVIFNKNHGKAFAQLIRNNTPRLNYLVRQARLPARDHRPDAIDDRSAISQVRREDGAIGPPARHALLVASLPRRS
jgi:hypothetical protein